MIYHSIFTFLYTLLVSASRYVEKIIFVIASRNSTSEIVVFVSLVLIYTTLFQIVRQLNKLEIRLNELENYQNDFEIRLAKLSIWYGQTRINNRLRKIEECLNNQTQLQKRVETLEKVRQATRKSYEHMEPESDDD